MIISRFLYAFVLTIVIEFMAAFLIGYRGKRFFIILALANLITNPLINYMLLVVYTMKLFNLYIFVEIFLEITVVIVEWRILSYALQRETKALFFLSLIVNASSYLMGIWLLS